MFSWRIDLSFGIVFLLSTLIFKTEDDSVPAEENLILMLFEFEIKLKVFL